MPATVTSGESFLTAFHDTRPGLTAKVFGEVPVVFRGTAFGSSYEVLSAVVSRTAAPMQVLDLACGDGFLLAQLAARSQPGLTLRGVDMSASELNAARARLAPPADLRWARAQELPFNAATFDYVLCHLALMLMDDAEQVLREVRRVLKTDAVFAAVIGAKPPPSAALARYIDVLAQHPPQGAFADVHLGDRRFRDLDGIHEVMSRPFRHVIVEEISIAQRLTPAELWYRFENMYDPHLRSESVRRSMELEFLAAVAMHRGADGKLDYPQTLRYISAIA